jgi:hypothetical protein
VERLRVALDRTTPAPRALGGEGVGAPVTGYRAGYGYDTDRFVVLPERKWSRLQQLLGDVLRNDDEMSLASAAASATLDLLDASSVSVGRFDSERGALQVLVNHGDLAEREQARPVDESYPMTQRPSVARWPIASERGRW